MKKIFIVLSLCFLTYITSLRTFAHELIPKALKEYVEANPNATASQIEKFVQNQTPEFAKKYQSGEEILKVIKNKNTNLLDNTLDFLRIGIQHILSGLDHILFVLAILLVFVSLRFTLKLTATFTLAHSITIILAGLGLLTLSSRIVEPFIALSIAYVAIITVFFKKNTFIGGTKSKIGAIFFFGLFHGLGFAGLLQELSIPKDKFISSIIGFNLGIEIGQLIIVALALPCIYLFRNKSWYGEAIQVVAILISLLAFFWFIERTIGLSWIPFLNN